MTEKRVTFAFDDPTPNTGYTPSFTWDSNGRIIPSVPPPENATQSYQVKRRLTYDKEQSNYDVKGPYNTELGTWDKSYPPFGQNARWWGPSKPFYRFPHSLPNENKNRIQVDSAGMPYTAVRTITGYRGARLGLPQRQKKVVYVGAYKQLPDEKKVAIADPNLLTIKQIKQILTEKGHDVTNWENSRVERPTKAHYVKLFSDLLPNEIMDVNWRRDQFARKGHGSKYIKLALQNNRCLDDVIPK